MIESIIVFVAFIVFIAYMILNRKPKQKYIEPNNRAYRRRKAKILKPILVKNYREVIRRKDLKDGNKTKINRKDLKEFAWYTAKQLAKGVKVDGGQTSKLRSWWLHFQRPSNRNMPSRNR